VRRANDGVTGPSGTKISVMRCHFEHPCALPQQSGVLSVRGVPVFEEDTMRLAGTAAFGLMAAFALPALPVSPAQAQSSPPVIQPRSVTVPPVIVIAPTAPPPPQTELIPPPPSGQDKLMVWQPGHWVWKDGAWSWEIGQYVMRPSGTATWTPGRWELQPNGSYIWMDGHWS
jgi:hypothetical protein